LKESYALISVSDKKGIIEFSKKLSELGIKIISTGGTAQALRKSGIPVNEVGDYTGFPEMLDGRVKTLHPKVEAGILADRRKKDHMSALKEHGFNPIDLVIVNLYPFQKTISSPNSTLEDAIENIDIGGPTLVRAAAKNHAGVTVVVDPADYGKVADELEKNHAVSAETRKKLAVKAFSHTAEYDSIIQQYLLSQYLTDQFPQTLNLTYKKLYDLRYGENSHQKAAFYHEGTGQSCVANAKIITEGRRLSFNNIIDLNNAIELVKEFERPAAAIVKHLNPSGVGEADDILEAYGLAHKADPQSAFGCIVALNRQPTALLAEKIASTFVEAVAAPEFSGECVKIFAKKERMRLIATGELKKTTSSHTDYRRVVGGMLAQTPDLRELTREDLKTATERSPTDDEIRALLFAWKVCRHTKSNSIIFAKPGYTTGVGAGQMSRVDAVKIASMKAGQHAKGSVMASDAFFPFPDGIEEAAKAGVTAVIHPGGSIRGEEVIKAADDHNMAMVITNTRCFLH
jgi:phosphoribosylaminoimidazolecarboxamide formyltransferase / IMP cyclohydrolase